MDKSSYNSTQLNLNPPTFTLANEVLYGQKGSSGYIIYRRDSVRLQQVRSSFDIFNWSSSVFLLRNQIPRATNEKQYGDKQTHLDSNQFSNANNEKPYGENLLLLLLLLSIRGKRKTMRA